MFKFTDILIPTDFSDQFNLALDYAKEMTKSIGSTLHIIHVIESTVMPADTVFSAHAKIVDVESKIKLQAEENMGKIENELKNENFKIQTGIIKGHPADEIIDYANDKKIDSICIATHGRSGFQRFLFGSTTEKVLRKAPCPVIAIRAPEYKK